MRIPMPAMTDGSTTIRPIAVRDARVLEHELAINRAWLRRWEATNPDGYGPFDTRAGIRALLEQARDGHGAPFALEVDGEFAGQVNVSQIFFGSLSSCAIGYWIAQRFAGRGVTPTAVALATDYCFLRLGLHRVEICIRPENGPSLRVVEKLGFRYEGLRRRYIHIDGGWRDHFAFAMTAEDAPLGLLRRWRAGDVDPSLARVPDADRAAAGVSPAT
ncbi:MAG: GNAT family N-acetyltransferase [Micrococcales bacterium 73-13]|nr:MAG: GNAT family N-acetyltransferase [Micrococcales bacterium 73-13]